MKIQLLVLLLVSFNTLASSNVLDSVEGTYKGKTVKKNKDCFLTASYDGDSWFKLEPYRSKKERAKLDKKSIVFSAHKSVMSEYFENEYSVYLTSVASDTSSLYNWMIGREAKDHILAIETNNDSIPVSFEFSSERSRKKRIFKCTNLQKI